MPCSLFVHKPMRAFLALWLLGGGLFAQNLSRGRAEAPFRTVILDPGHGGKDPGAVGARHYEKDLALQVALRLRELIHEEMPDIQVVLTREDDTFIELHRRAEIAKNAGGDIFISIHCNGLRNKSKFGTETYVLGTNQGQENYEVIIAENEAILFEENYHEMYGGFDPSSPEGYIFFKLLKNVFRSESTNLADKVQGEFAMAGRKDRGVKQAPFVVLYLSGMPAILTEIGFITNYEEETFLASVEGQDQIATNIVDALKAYYEEFSTSAVRSEQR
ncbi:MAG: N-acetylmuramoyl-L-alanine amidase [Bacteroidota bacterium]